MNANTYATLQAAAIQGAITLALADPGVHKGNSKAVTDSINANYNSIISTLVEANLSRDALQ